MAQHLDPKTLSYSESAKGWPSFYSYLPDYMIGMNGFLYSFGPTINSDGTVSGGNLYRHNTNEERNNYYDVQYSSTLTGVLNIEPKTIKLFKTMSYESDDAWECTSLLTDLGAGSMLSTYFEQKEGEWFTFLREVTGTKNFKSRSVNGIGSCNSVLGPAAGVVIIFPFSMGNIISIGDYVYSTTSSVYTGQITAIDKVNNWITVNTLIPEVTTGVAGAPPAIGDYIFFLKNPVAESHGARGYFMQFTLKNEATTAVELFAVGSSVMKSYP